MIIGGRRGETGAENRDLKVNGGVSRARAIPEEARLADKHISGTL
jgi:hypothetical protein